MIRFLTIPLFLLSLPPLLAQPVHTDTGQELLFRELCYVGSFEEGEDILDIPETERDEAVLSYAVNHYTQGATEKIVMRW